MKKSNEIQNRLESLLQDLESIQTTIVELESNTLDAVELCLKPEYKESTRYREMIRDDISNTRFELVEALQDDFGSDEIQFLELRGQYAIVSVEVYNKTFKTKIRVVDLLDDNKLINTLYDCDNCNDWNYNDDKARDWFVIGDKLICEDCKDDAIQGMIDEEATEIKCNLCYDAATQMWGDENYCEDCLKEVFEENYLNEIY